MIYVCFIIIIVLLMDGYQFLLIVVFFFCLSDCYSMLFILLIVNRNY